MPVVAAKSPGPKINVSMRSEAGAIDSIFTSPRGLSICTSRPMRRVRPSSASSCREQPVGEVDVAGRLDLREHDAIEIASGTLDDVDDVAEAPPRAHGVHTHDLRRGRPARRPKRVDDVLPRGVVLLERRDGVLEVEKHLVCRQRRRLGEHLRARAGCGQARAAKPRYRHYASSRSTPRSSTRNPSGSIMYTARCPSFGPLVTVTGSLTDSTPAVTSLLY